MTKINSKTQIALEYAYRLRAQTNCSVFWIHADNEARFSQDYGKIATEAGLFLDRKGDELLQDVCRWISQQHNWLLILDNADNLDMFKASRTSITRPEATLNSPELYRFIPTGDTGSVLWTTRDGNIKGRLVAVKQTIEIKAMSPSEARELFIRISEYDASPMSAKDEADLKKMLDYLERLPLAIVQAATYIRQTHSTVQEYNLKLETSEESLAKQLEFEFDDRYRDSNVPNCVIQTWGISMNHISHGNPLAQKIFQTVVFFDRQGIPLELIYAAAGEGVEEDDVLIAVSRRR